MTSGYDRAVDERASESAARPDERLAARARRRKSDAAKILAGLAFTAVWLVVVGSWAGSMSGRDAAGGFVLALVGPPLVFALLFGMRGGVPRKPRPQRPPRRPGAERPSAIRLRHSRAAIGVGPGASVLIRLAVSAYVLGGGFMLWHLASDARVFAGAMFLWLALPIGVLVLRRHRRPRGTVPPESAP